MRVIDNILQIINIIKKQNDIYDYQEYIKLCSVYSLNPVDSKTYYQALLIYNEANKRHKNKSLEDGLEIELKRSLQFQDFLSKNPNALDMDGIPTVSMNEVVGGCKPCGGGKVR